MSKSKTKREKSQVEANEQAVEALVKSEVKDRSHLNCKPCAGLGLLPNGNICQDCKGKGKI